jgi:pyridoxamine 5'-phosphate oxidase
VPDFAQPLREADVDPNPLRQFAIWFEAAADAGVRAPEAVVLATASPEAVPSARMVLLKDYDERGFVIFTNYESRKALELDANPRAALLFYWDALGRQVRIEGPVQRTTAEETAAYVRTRPRGSQLSALASPQSRPIASREALEERVAELAARYEGEELPISEGWGGFRVTPESFEFWQHREDRLHDRLVYTRRGGDWALERLAP